MPSVKIVRTRTAGWCEDDFAHPSKIEVGDRIKVITLFPREHHYTTKTPIRIRKCSWCLEEEILREAEAVEWAALSLIAPAGPKDTHVPCCSSHKVPMTCKEYRRTHFVEVGVCCPAFAEAQNQ